MATKNPSWWNNEHESSWEKVKGAFRRDWEQTKNDMGSKSAPDLHQNAGDTIKQATGSQPGTSQDFSKHEGAFRYGLGAQKQYQGQRWDDTLESTLRGDYPGDWDDDRESIRHAYGYSSSPNNKI